MKKAKVLSLAVLAAAATAVAGSASAAVDASVQTMLTGVQSDATTLGTMVTPVVVGILAISIGIALIKRFAKKV